MGAQKKLVANLDETKQQNEIKNQVFAAIVVSLGSLVVGFASSYTAPALDSMYKSNSSISITEQQASWIGSLMPLFALVGGTIGGPLIDIFGRKKTILATAFPFIASFLLIGLARDVTMIMVGRALTGLGVGLTTLALPVYLGETIQPRIRGVLGLLPTTVGNIGVLLSYTCGMFLNWSYLAILGATLPLPFLVLMFLIPETPRWYIKKNKTKEAKRALRWLRGKDGDIKGELSEIQNRHDEDEATHRSFTDFFTMSNLQPIYTTLGLMFFQQMSGINAVIFYSVSIFKDAGSSINSNLSSIILAIVNVFSTLGANVLIDKLGRKVLLTISSCFMGLTLGVLGWFFSAQESEKDMSNYGWIPLLCLMIYIIGFSIGFGPIPWLMMGELLPAKIKGPAASISTAFNWACSFLVTKTFSDLNMMLGSQGTFWLFASFCLLSISFIYRQVPETKGKSLEDIENYFSEEKKEKPSHLAPN